jgi:hypothetical protein
MRWGSGQQLSRESLLELMVAPQVWGTLASFLCPLGHSGTSLAFFKSISPSEGLPGFIQKDGSMEAER